MTYDPYAALRPFNEWPDAFSEEELQEIVACGDGLLPAGGGTAALAADAAPSWLPARLGEIVERINAAFYRFDLSGLSGTPRYQRLTSGAGPVTGWRREMGPEETTPKLCLRLQLSGPEASEGGVIEVRGVGAAPAPRQRGLMIAFPSYYRHRVTPVRSGECRLLALDAAGPAFR